MGSSRVMRIPRLHNYILVSLIIALPFALLAWAASDTEQYPICDKSIHTGREECVDYDLIFFAGIQIAKFLNDASAFITAVATGVIAAFTITIWTNNRSQLKHSREVDRAYVSGGGAPTDKYAAQFVLTVENYGQTPAMLREFVICF